MAAQLTLGDIDVDVVFKDIKNVHLSVHPPTGRVRIAAPARMNLDTVRVFALSKLDWIKRNQSKLQDQDRESPREYLERESHYLWGTRYLLSVLEGNSAPSVKTDHNRLLLRVRRGSAEGARQSAIAAWYRSALRQAIPPLIARWEPVIGVKVERFFVQRMKTKWGSCNAGASTIRLNTELAKKPRECLEYVVVHEMAHILEPSHNARFTSLMDQFMPGWRFRRQQLNELPLAHEDWLL
ncbi:MAG: M48 family metallopeptidase [Dehalococcoidia bacterium]|nr:M48 family metallopeptidase [Dehalococcoidia bacterium]